MSMETIHEPDTTHGKGTEHRQNQNVEHLSPVSHSVMSAQAHSFQSIPVPEELSPPENMSHEPLPQFEPDDTEDMENETDIDTEMAILALEARDLGEPTVTLDIAALSPNEKRALIRLMRERLGISVGKSGYDKEKGDEDKVVT